MQAHKSRTTTLSRMQLLKRVSQGFDLLHRLDRRCVVSKAARFFPHRERAALPVLSTSRAQRARLKTRCTKLYSSGRCRLPFKPSVVAAPPSERKRNP
mmetsp:Transcript_12783/g.34385  ORF Transcript_12783/g.34385 Transcript_12783/m.34385 type:complete len:98 (-) Transcript_12783:342-635(-)